MGGIRVDKRVKRIEVNDQGEYIELALGDQTFPVRFYEMLERIDSKIKAYNAEAMELDRQYKDAAQAERERAICDFNVTIHTAVRDEIDGFFGPETCRKVFGDIVPSIDMYNDFFEQLSPYFSEFAQERAQKMSKYSLERQGNV